jgi:hypothetical protein
MEVRRNPPHALIIDLSRVPSQGRDLGIYFRKQRSTRHVPLIFAGGAEEKLARVRALLPDATYTDWRRIRSALREALRKHGRAPVVPASVMDAYAGTPVPRKLGVRAGALVALIRAPRGFESGLAPLPAGARFTRRATPRADFTIWFTRKKRDLARLEDVAERSRGELWIAWPKQAAGISSDLNQQIVRREGLAIGLVDYKICAIDDTWSALRFTRRGSKR